MLQQSKLGLVFRNVTGDDQLSHTELSDSSIFLASEFVATNLEHRLFISLQVCVQPKVSGQHTLLPWQPVAGIHHIGRRAEWGRSGHCAAATCKDQRQHRCTRFSRQCCCELESSLRDFMNVTHQKYNYSIFLTSYIKKCCQIDLPQIKNLLYLTFIYTDACLDFCNSPSCRSSESCCCCQNSVVCFLTHCSRNICDNSPMNNN